MLWYGSITGNTSGWNAEEICLIGEGPALQKCLWDNNSATEYRIIADILLCSRIHLIFPYPCKQGPTTGFAWYYVCINRCNKSLLREIRQRRLAFLCWTVYNDARSGCQGHWYVEHAREFGWEHACGQCGSSKMAPHPSRIAQMSIVVVVARTGRKDNWFPNFRLFFGVVIWSVAYSRRGTPF